MYITSLCFYHTHSCCPTHPIPHIIYRLNNFSTGAYLVFRPLIPLELAKVPLWSLTQHISHIVQDLLLLKTLPSCSLYSEVQSEHFADMWVQVHITRTRNHMLRSAVRVSGLYLGCRLALQMIADFGEVCKL